MTRRSRSTLAAAAVAVVLGAGVQPAAGSAGPPSGGAPLPGTIAPAGPVRLDSPPATTTNQPASGVSGGPIGPIVDTTDFYRQGMYFCRDIPTTGVSRWYAPNLTASPDNQFWVAPWVHVYDPASNTWNWFGTNGWGSSSWYGPWLAQANGTREFMQPTDSGTMELPWSFGFEIPAGHNYRHHGYVIWGAFVNGTWNTQEAPLPTSGGDADGLCLTP